MLRTRIAAGVVATAMVGSMGVAAAAPATAKGKGLNTTVTFTGSVNSALKGAGVTVSAKKPGKLKGGSLVFPAKVKGDIVTHKGGLVLTNTATSQKVDIENIRLDLANKSATVDVVGVGEGLPVFDVAKVKKTKKKTTAQLRIATGIATALNGLLGVTFFKDGQTLANTQTKK